MTRKLCTEYIDPQTIEPLLANRPMPLDKGEGAVHPIGVGEVIRRVVGKCIMKVTKEDVVDTSGSLQVCAGQANRAPDACLDIHARGFWERQRSVFFDVGVCYPNADSYRDLDLKQIYKQHENDKKRLYVVHEE